MTPEAESTGAASGGPLRRARCGAVRCGEEAVCASLLPLGVASHPEAQSAVSRSTGDDTIQHRLRPQHIPICSPTLRLSRIVAVSLSTQSIVVITARHPLRDPVPGPLLTLSGRFEIFPTPYRPCRFAACVI
jgi:hypothetical protein